MQPHWFHLTKLWQEQLVGRSRRTPMTAWPSEWRESTSEAGRRRYDDAEWSWCKDDCTNLQEIWNESTGRWNKMKRIVKEKNSDFKEWAKTGLILNCTFEHPKSWKMKLQCFVYIKTFIPKWYVWLCWFWRLWVITITSFGLGNKLASSVKSDGNWF